MVDTELAESEVDRLIDVCHKQGLSYWEILKIFLKKCEVLAIQSECEYYIKGGT